MKIKHWMTRNPITVSPSTPLMEASALMKERNIRRLPVVERGKLVGIVTHRNILEASPSEATTLSIHELNYLIANLTVGEVMHTDVVAVGPEDSVLDVVLMGHEKGIGAFPVVDRGRLVGIATDYEIYNAFINIFGGGREDNHIIILKNVHLTQRIGALSRIAGTIEALDTPVLAVFSLPHRDSPGRRLHVRIKAPDPAPAVKALQKAGYIVEEAD